MRTQDRLNQLRDANATLRAEKAELWAALKRYGRHDEECNWPIIVRDLPCACGLDELLKGADHE